MRGRPGEEEKKTTESKSVSISITNDEKKVDILTKVDGVEVKKTLTGQEAEDYIKENGNGMHYSDDGSELDLDITTGAMNSPEVKAKLDELLETIKKESKIEGKNGKQTISINISTDDNEEFDLEKLLDDGDAETKTIVKTIIIETDDKKEEH